MLAGSELQTELSSHIPQLIAIEDQVMDHSSPESNIWNAVLLQLLKEAEYIKRDLVISGTILNDKTREAKQRSAAFQNHCKVQNRKKSMEIYIRSEDFAILCDFANHNVDCVVPKVRDILNGRLAITDNQVKRTFTRKPDPKGRI